MSWTYRVFLPGGARTQQMDVVLRFFLLLLLHLYGNLLLGDFNSETF
jgi:hypothetical protein